MKRNISIVIVILLFIGGFYIFLLAPSKSERSGDKKYEKKDYRGSIVLYTQALSQNQVSFNQERLLFKLGNAYRLVGQKDRALDFYMKILRDNPDSVYRERIQGLLTLEVTEFQQITEDTQAHVVDLAPFKGPLPENIVTLKARRDALYLELIRGISTMEGALDMSLVEAFKRFKDMNKHYHSKKIEFSSEQVEIIKSGVSRSLALISMGEGVGDRLRKQELVYDLQLYELDSIEEILQLASDTKLDGVFIRLEEIVDTKTTLNLSRLLDLFEKAKIFLLLDDSSTVKEKFELSEKLSERIYLLSCNEEENCRGRILEVLRLRSLWQSNG